jgi:hypothetical protein
MILTPCVTITFLIVWVTEQFSSFNQPFGDFFYTICYTANRNSPYCTTNSAYASTAFILLIILYRMIQNLKIWQQDTLKSETRKYAFNAPPFICFLGGLTAFITTIISVLNRLKVFEGIFYLWLAFSIIATIYAWVIDVHYNWGFISRKSKQCLRENYYSLEQELYTILLPFLTLFLEQPGF